MTEAPASYFRWSDDGEHIYFIQQRGNNDLWAVTLEGGSERRMTRFTQKAGSLGSYALAADKGCLYFAWRNDLGDIWVMDVVSGDNE